MPVPSSRSWSSRITDSVLSFASWEGGVALRDPSQICGLGMYFDPNLLYSTTISPFITSQCPGKVQM